MDEKKNRDFNSWKPESEQSGYVLSSKSKKIQEIHISQPTDKMLEFDNMVRGFHSSILCPLQATRKWPSLGTMLFKYEGEEPSKFLNPME